MEPHSLTKGIMSRKIAVGTSVVNAQYDLEVGEKYVMYLALASVYTSVAIAADTPNKILSARYS
jgi:hypothetical protein